MASVGDQLRAMISTNRARLSLVGFGSLLVPLVMTEAAWAQASVTRLGKSDAGTCYQEAFSANGEDLSACNRALKDRSTTARDRRATFVNRGILLNRLGEYDRAIEDFTEALDGDPELGEALLNRGNSLFLQKNFSSAMIDYEAALNASFNKPEVAWYNIGLTHRALKDDDAARIAFEKSLQERPGFTPAVEQLRILDISGEPDRLPTDEEAA
ncbi:MAG: tetratricopeptide repeat protein [Pseudomonadota bacterium]